MDNQEKISVILVDDHKIFLDGLRMLLSTAEGIAVMDSFNNAEIALSWLKVNKVDVIITDLNMPGLGGVKLITEVKKYHPEIKCIALTMLDDFLSVNESIEAGVDAYLLKNTTITELVMALNHVMNNLLYVSPEINSLLIQGHKRNENPIFTLTAREREVLQLIVAGNSSKQIADILSLSTDTIKFHRKNLLSKLNQPNVAALVSFALKNGLN